MAFRVALLLLSRVLRSEVVRFISVRDYYVILFIYLFSKILFKERTK